MCKMFYFLIPQFAERNMCTNVIILNSSIDRDPESTRRRSNMQPPLTTLSDIYELPVKPPMARSRYSSLHDR